MSTRCYLWALRLSFAALLACSLSCSKSGKGVDEDDGNTPFIILDLRVGAVSDSSVTLKWTATGDDADVGTATKYDVRHYHSYIRSSNWDSCTQVTGEPAPHAAGSTDSMEVRGLKTDSTYYFAIVACDEASNCTTPSNCASATCYNNAIVTFPDQNLEAAIRTAISKPSGDIHRLDLMNLTFLEGNGRGIASLTGLEYCTNLEVLFMSYNDISDLQPLAALSKLYALQFVHNQIRSIAPLATLNNLTYIILRSNKVSDLTAFTDLNKLHLVDVSSDSISSIAPMVANLGFADTDTLVLSGNPLSDAARNFEIPELQARGVTVIYVVH